MSCDLHCHSRNSDGSLNINELMSLALQRRLTALAITDHDTMAGIPEAMEIGKRLGITVIPGIEMSTKDLLRNRKVHILGYLCDSPDCLEKSCLNMMESRRSAAKEMLSKVMQHYPITPELVAKYADGSSVIYKQHIMHALIESGYSNEFFGDVFRKLFSFDGGVAYAPIEYPDVRQTIDLIHSAGGIAVMAHPYTYDSIALMEELVNDGLLDGIEVWHPSNDAQRVKHLSEFADAHQLVKTGGTDFHGLYTDSPHPLGFCTAPSEVIQQLYDAKEKRFK